jgi:membrane protein
LNLTSLTLTIAAIISLLLAIAAVIVLPVLLNYVRLSYFSETLLRVLRWPALLVLIIAALVVLYRFGPSRTEPRWGMA